MRIFEYPYIIITLLVFFFVVFCIISIYFALRGIKETKGTEQIGFSNISRLEGIFGKLCRLRTNRSVVYISVSLENARSLYSDSKAWRIYSEIKPVILKNFVSEENSAAAVYDQQNFIALNTHSVELNVKMIEKSSEEINQLLLKFNAVNVADIRFGLYSAATTEVDFDEAINRAKQACMIAENKNALYVEWNRDGGKTLEKRIEIENNIKNEIDNNKFFLEYQPVVDAKTKKIVGTEVLARLNSQQNGIVAPEGFLSALDSVGLSGKFDYYIFEKNCKWISNNKEQREKYEYAINFSRTTLCDPMFAEKIISIIEKYNLSYSSVAIEVLEDKEVGDDAKKQIIMNLSKLRQKGISVLLDDFGGGYTSFGDLQNFPVNIVKIDRSITQNTKTETGLVIFRNIVKTAKDIGLKTICEGIETEEQERIATEAGCDMLQGFYYYRPMPVAGLEQAFGRDTDKL